MNNPEKPGPPDSTDPWQIAADQINCAIDRSLRERREDERSNRHTAEVVAAVRETRAQTQLDPFGRNVAHTRSDDLEIDKIAEEVDAALRRIGRAATITEIATKAGRDAKTTKKRLVLLEGAGRVRRQKSGNWEPLPRINPR